MAHFFDVDADPGLPRIAVDQGMRSGAISQLFRRHALPGAGTGKRVVTHFGENVGAPNGKSSARGQTDVIFPVLVLPELRPRTAPITRLLAHEECRGEPDSAFEKSGKHPRNRLAVPAGSLHLAGTIEKTMPNRAKGDVGLGVVAQRFQLDFGFSRQEQIVAVEILEECAVRKKPPGLPSRAWTGVGLMNAPGSRMRRRELVANCGRLVGRPVVHEDDLDRAMSLGEHAVDRFAQHSGTIEDRNDRGNEIRN